MELRSFGSATAISLALAASLVLGGCARDTRTTGSVSRDQGTLSQMSVPQLEQQMRKADAAYQRKPKDKAAGLTYASLLRMTGRDEQALAVMRQMVIYHPQDNEVLSAYGKALAATGNLVEALGVIERAQRPDRPDWRLLSAQGAILDQLERTADAREYYRKALDIVPEEPTVLSNLGMSYLLSNDLGAAETYLRNASSKPGADSRIRQNLALVVGLQGRFDEAEKIASAELPPEAAKENIAYLRQMLTQQNAWSQLKQEDAPAAGAEAKPQPEPKPQ
jgi:Flp pilus assembly protein TadD